MINIMDYRKIRLTASKTVCAFAFVGIGVLMSSYATSDIIAINSNIVCDDADSSTFDTYLLNDSATSVLGCQNSSLAPPASFPETSLVNPGLVTITEGDSLVLDLAGLPASSTVFFDFDLGFSFDSSFSSDESTSTPGSFIVTWASLVGYGFDGGPGAYPVRFLLADVSTNPSTGSFDSFTIQVNQVPLPAAAWLFGSALLGLGVIKRKKA